MNEQLLQRGVAALEAIAAELKARREQEEAHFQEPKYLITAAVVKKSPLEIPAGGRLG